MARLQKVGIDYFPLDVDIDQDDKVAIIEAKHGITGFGIVIKLLMKIYKEGYFYEWNEREQILFSRRVNVDINEVNVIINDCVTWGMFDESLFNEHKVLTSRGIQKRYLEITKRRVAIEMIEEYLLIDAKEINTRITLVNVNINSLNADIGTQSKVKESKVKESKEKVKRDIVKPNGLGADEKTEKTPYDDIVNLYNEICGNILPRVQVLSDKRRKTIKRIWGFVKNDIQALENIFLKAEGSDFLSGRNGKWTSCNFDWLINQNNAIKVLEGNYDNKGSGGKPPTIEQQMQSKEVQEFLNS